MEKRAKITALGSFSESFVCNYFFPRAFINITLIISEKHRYTSRLISSFQRFIDVPLIKIYIFSLFVTHSLLSQSLGMDKSLFDFIQFRAKSLFCFIILRAEY